MTSQGAEETSRSAGIIEDVGGFTVDFDTLWLVNLGETLVFWISFFDI